MSNKEKQQEPETKSELELQLERYKETVGFIKSVCVDYIDRPREGLMAIKFLIKGVSEWKRSK